MVCHSFMDFHGLRGTIMKPGQVYLLTHLIIVSSRRLGQVQVPGDPGRGSGPPSPATTLGILGEDDNGSKGGRLLWVRV